MCCKPAIQVKDEGEWMEPISNKKNKRHVSQIENNSTDDKRATLVDNKQKSVRWSGFENVSTDDKRATLVDNKQKNVRWSALVGNLNQMDISDLNNPKVIRSRIVCMRML